MTLQIKIINEHGPYTARVLRKESPEAEPTQVAVIKPGEATQLTIWKGVSVTVEEE